MRSTTRQSQCALEIALLRAGQRMVEDNEIGIGRDAPRGDFVDLAAAGEQAPDRAGRVAR